MSKEGVVRESTSRSKDTMEGLMRKQDDLLDRINSAYTTFKKSPKERITSSYIKARLEIIETMWESFTKTHSEIVASCSKTDKAKLLYFTEDVYSSFESMFLDYKTKLCDIMEDLQPVTSEILNLQTKAADTSCEVKLPQIHLPKFSSGYEEWQTFHDMFESLIHKNINLSSVQKLHYLKSCLSGEAESLIKNLSTTEVNYNEAWNQLKERYSNKRYNCNEVMKRLFAQRAINMESAYSIKQILDTTSACLKSLTNLGINVESWDAIINHLVLSKLDQETRKQWENYVSQITSVDLPTWSQLKRFLETRFRTLEILDGGRSGSRHVQQNLKPTASVKFVSTPKLHHATLSEKKEGSNYACLMCSGQHALYQCKQYANQTPQERTEYVQSRGLCFNCLSPNHNVRSCHHATCCRRCDRRHHTTLHFERGQYQESTNVDSKSQESQSSTSKEQLRKEAETKVVAHFTKKSQLSRVLLATARVRITSPNGYSLIVRALIDQGSEASFISEDIVQSLSLKRVNVNGIVSGVGEGVTKTKGMVSYQLESLHNSNFSIPVNAYVLKNLTSFLPSQECFITKWRDVENLPLADPGYGNPLKIDAERKFMEKSS